MLECVLQDLRITRGDGGSVYVLVKDAVVGTDHSTPAPEAAQSPDPVPAPATPLASAAPATPVADPASPNPVVEASAVIEDDLIL
jgi:hypothetical protein